MWAGAQFSGLMMSLLQVRVGTAGVQLIRRNGDEVWPWRVRAKPMGELLVTATLKVSCAMLFKQPTTPPALPWSVHSFLFLK